jgi:hypothetical protein
MSAPVPEVAQMRAKLNDWTIWLDRQTDRLLALDERVKVSGSPADQGDVAAAFVARKAIGDRLAAVEPLIEKNRREATALMSKPLIDAMGGPVGKDIDDAARLLEAITNAVEQRLATTEQQQSVDFAKIQAMEADLGVAERLAGELGEQVNQVAQLRQQQAARRDLDGVAATARKVRVALEQNDRERQRVLASFSVAADRIQRLADRERDVRELQARCTEKILRAPRLAVPSVAALGGGPDPAQVSAMPWKAARAQIEPFVDKLDRVERALDEAAARFAAPVAERDELRGLLDGFRGKAGAHGFSEDPTIEPVYRRARELLWSAPCDLDAARPLVQQYVAGVNTRLATGGGAAR